MFSNINLVAITLVGMAIFITSCNDSHPKRITEVSEVTEEKSKDQGVLYKPSELALEMRRMYDNMKIVGDSLNARQNFSDSLLMGYDAILSAKATNPDEITDLYYGFANGWLSELAVFKTNKTIGNYHALMNACVNCHKSFCPGPIPKIKKLKIAPV